VTGDENATDQEVVQAIAKATACVRAWLRVQDVKRAERVPDPRTTADAARVAAALARASQLAHAAPPGGPRYEMRKHAAERLQSVFYGNVVAAQKGYADAQLDIEAVCDEVSAAFDAWS
jgi:hypothetical protein